MLKLSHDKGARRSAAFCFGIMMMRNLWLVFMALSSVHGLSHRKYVKVDETCVNSVISKHFSTHKLHCGQLCESNRPQCSGFCFSSAQRSCTLHKIVGMGPGTVEKGFRTYMFFADLKTQYDSFFHCIGIGAFLALPKNLEQENYFLQLSNGNDIYLPSEDNGHEGYWYTSGDSTLYGGGKGLSYSHWASGEPGGGTNENCVVLSSMGWRDYGCTVLKARVCQAPRAEICTTLPHPAYPDLCCYKRKV